MWRTRVALGGVAAVSPQRGCARPPPEGGKESAAGRRGKEKEKLTPDDAGADKTTNDNVCRALARLFLTFRDNLVPRLPPPNPSALLGDFIRRISSRCVCRERERERERENRLKVLSAKPVLPRLSACPQKSAPRCRHGDYSEINCRSIVRCPTHYFAKLTATMDSRSPTSRESPKCLVSKEIRCVFLHSKEKFYHFI